LEQAGAYIVPWGRVVVLEREIADAMKRKEEGGTGVAERFYKWCDDETKKYAS
jgi:retinol dehydrogenase-12